MKPVLLLSLPLLLLSPVSSADTSYEQWRQQTRADFQAYLDANDKAFIQFLQRKWQPVEVEKPTERDAEPKPEEQPQARQPQQPPADDTPLAEIRPPEPAPAPVPAPPAQPPLSTTLPLAQVDFYSHALNIPYAPALRKSFRGRLNNDRIAAYWQQLASADFRPTVAALQQQMQALQLNDWGAATLIDRFSRTLHHDQSSRQLLNWFLLVKTGYDARVAYNDQIFLLLPSAQEMFGVTFFRLSGKLYYAVNLNDKAMKPGKVFTYDGQHEEGRRTLDFSNPSRFLISGPQRTRDLQFRYDGRDYRLSIPYAQAYVDYFNGYPQLALPGYFQAGMPAATAAALRQQLRPLLEGQTELEATNRLLRFVQTAFAYQMDEEQFHEENYLFPLETLHYPYSDCEDRAALFAWLTENLLGLDVVILNYPGHVATAVAFTSPVQGDAVQLHGKRYVVADPTYANADAGMSMPGMKPSQASVIAF